MGSSRAKQPSRGNPSGRLSEGASGGQPGHPNDASSRYLPRFFVDSSQFAVPPSTPPVPLTGAIGREFSLDPEDAYHALKVLRLERGDSCEVVVTPAASRGDSFGVSAGVAYLATVTSVTNEVRVTPRERLEGRRAGADYANAVGVVQAITRPAAVDFLVEKGTEVGASFFFLVADAGSSFRPRSAQNARLTRWRRIAREASKQSKQLAVPPVEISNSFDEAFELLGAGTHSFVLEPDAPDGLYEVLSSTSLGQAASVGGARPAGRPARLALWVGPESGWTEKNLARLAAAGARAVRLGRGVLRAETAGPVAVAVARLALGDW